MTHRSRFAAILAVLIVAVSFATSACTGGNSIFKRTNDGGYEYTEGTDVWTWDQKGSAAQVMLNGKLFADIQNSVAKVSLPDGRSLDVLLDSGRSPVGITRMAWDMPVDQMDYKLMNTAFYVNRLATGQNPGSPIGWVIFLLIVILAGVLLFIYAGSLVNSWKLGGIFSGKDTARSLLVFKALGILLIVIGAIILLVVVF